MMIWKQIFRVSLQLVMFVRRDFVKLLLLLVMGELLDRMHMNMLKILIKKEN
ncbi:hypothetical protein HMPREF9278_0909 [Mobiluncus mulieris FB024-16]|nr:hypothetical protein HMPREF9278_0909 [Mobiluncus mulieris FB024-16]